MKIKREDMVTALSLAKAGLSPKQSINQTGTFVFKDDCLWTFNDEILVSVPIKTGIECAVPSKELTAFINRSSAEEINVKFEKGQFRASAGRTRCGINSEAEITLPIDDLEIPEEQDWIDIPKRFLDGVSATAGSTGRDSSQLSLECIHITKKGFMEACDNYQATLYDLEEEFDSDVLLPARNVLPLKNIEPFHYAVTKDWVWFINDRDVIFAVRSHWGEFLATEDFMDVEGPQVELPAELGQALGDADIFVDDDGERNVSVSLESGKMKVKGEGDMGWLEESIPIKYKGEAVAFQINPTFLSRIISRMKEVIIGEIAIVFKEKGCSHAISIEA